MGAQMNKCLNCGEAIDLDTAHDDEFCCESCADEYFEAEEMDDDE